MSTINAYNPAAASASTEPAVIQGFRAVKDMFKEAHPFARKPQYLRPHAVAWEFYTAKLGRATRFYVPGLVLFFGWPFAAQWITNQYNGVHKKSGR